MTTRDDLRRQTKEARASAAKARRLAGSWGISSEFDVDRLIVYAAELDKKAEALEAEARAADLSVPPVTPVVTHSQQQQVQHSDPHMSDTESTTGPPRT